MTKNPNTDTLLTRLDDQPDALSASAAKEIRGLREAYTDLSSELEEKNRTIWGILQILEQDGYTLE